MPSSRLAYWILAALSLPPGPAVAAAAKPYPRVPAGRSVYEAPANLAPGKHGDLVQAVEIATAVPGARAWKVLYRSTDLRGVPSLVSGLVVAPRGNPPAGGRPVVTFAHGTTG